MEALRQSTQHPNLRRCTGASNLACWRRREGLGCRGSRCSVPVASTSVSARSQLYPISRGRPKDWAKSPNGCTVLWYHESLGNQ